MFNENFLDPGTNHYKVQTQTALSCAIFQGLASGQAVENTVNDLVACIHAKNNHLDFGLLGSKYVLNVLRESGHNDLAYSMINQKGFPSWGAWVEDGGTTLREDWEGVHGSRNHIFLCDFSTWYFKSLGGIQPDPEAPGFGHFFLKPCFPEEISFVKTSYNSIHGKIVSDWKRVGDKIEMGLVVPANTTSSFYVPAGFKVETIAGPNGKRLVLKINSGIINLVAGHYKLALKHT